LTELVERRKQRFDIGAGATAGDGRRVG